jgi:eukaryotic-like serine/threonine-protein kinase
MRSVGEIVAAKYRVVRQIAEGGMGILFEAVHISLEERVAIKFVRAAELGKDAIARFEREARLAVKLRTEHVARVLDAGRDEAGDPFIVMEYLEGIDLGELVRTRGPIGGALAADYLVQACHGLAEAHALTIVHRDVKPANLFLTEDAAGLPIIKVLDFGISKAVDSGGEELTASPERAAQLLGTPHYVSPEQLLTPHEVDARADIWSLGVCGWALATGVLPFSQSDLIMLFANILNKQAPSIATARADLPEAFVRAIDRCLQRKRDDRFRDVAELAEALGSLTTARTHPLVEHTMLLLERGKSRAAGMSLRPSQISFDPPMSGNATRAEGRNASGPMSGNIGGGATANLNPAPPVAPTGSAMVVSHTLPVMPMPVALSPSYPPPSLPRPSKGVPAVVIGGLVVAVAGVVVILVGLRVLPHLRHPPTAPVPAQAASAPLPALDLPSAAVPTATAPTTTMTAATSTTTTTSTSTTVAPAASTAPKRPTGPRPAPPAPPPHPTGDGIPTLRGVPPTRE